MLSKHRNEPAARAFLNKTIGHNGLLKKVVIDKSGANLAALESVNFALFLMGCLFLMVDILQVKYLNNIVEQSLLREICIKCWGLNPWKERLPLLPEMTTANAEKRSPL